MLLIDIRILNKLTRFIAIYMTAMLHLRRAIPGNKCADKNRVSPFSYSVLPGFLLFSLLLMVNPEYSKADDIRVSKNGKITTLKQGLDLAQKGDRIILEEGTYKEHDVIIDKPVTIEGEGNVIIDGDRQGFVLIVRSDSVTIRGLNVQHAKVSFINDNAAILLDEVGHCVIENNTLKDNFFGIYLAKSYDSIVRNNDISGHFTSESASGNGIHLWYSKNITVENNRIDGQRDGIYFEFVEQSHIRDNYSTHNLRYGLHFMFSDNCTYTNNTFRDNSAGVAVMYTHHVTMEGNHFIYNWGAASYGLLLKEITDSSIKNNVFEHNTIGIYTEASNRIQVEHNDFIQNGWAAKIMANSVDNHFERNNFIANTFEVSTNSRQNFNHFDGNYWSEYEGYDLDRNGIGDVPYRPVRLFSYMVERQPQALILLRSLLIELLDTAERFMPVLTPETLVDSKPRMRIIQ